MNVPMEENITTSCNYTGLWVFTKENQAMNYLVRIITDMITMEPKSFYDQSQLFLGKLSTPLADTITHSWTQNMIQTVSMSWITETPSFNQWTLLNLLDEPIFCIIENLHLTTDPSECQQLLIDVATAKNSASPLRILVTTESYVHEHTQEAPYDDQDMAARFSMLNEQGVAYLPLHLQSEQAMFASIKQSVQEGILLLIEEKSYWADFTDEIREKICIEGTTQLLAMHQINLLRFPVPPTTKLSLKQMLEYLPLTLEDVCTQALSLPSASGETQKKRALSALCWIVFAFRPLEVREAAIALAFENESINSIHLLKGNVWNDIVGDLSAILGPLLRVVGNHLYPIHHTIRTLPILASEKRAFHLQALITCIKYLRIILKENRLDNIEQPHAGKMRISFVKPECDLLRYSSIYWPDHFRIAFSNEPCWDQDADAAQRAAAFDLTYEFINSKPLLDEWSKAYNIFAPDIYGSEPVDLLDITGLTAACKFGLLPIVQKYTSDDSIRISAAEFTNALDIAARFGHADIAKWLLSRGTLSPRAIYLASIGGHVDVIKELVQKDFQVDHADNNGYTSLLHTARLGHLKALRFLLQNGASTAKKSQDDSTALHLSSRIGHLSAVKELMDRSDCGYEDKEGYTALHRAAAGGCFEVVAYLYPRYKDIQKISCVTKNHDTVLHLAVVSGSYTTCQLLLQQKDTAVLINMTNKQRKTPLHFAAEYGYLDIMRCILDIVDNGLEFQIMGLSDISAVTSGKTVVEKISPSRLTAQNGHLAIMAELLDRQVSRLKQTSTTTDSVWSNLDEAYLCLRDAASAGHINIVHKLLNASVAVSKPDDQEHTPLQLAAMFGHSDIAKELSASASQEDQQAALLLALQIGDPKVVRSLIRSGTPLTRTKSGKSFIHLAVESGHIQVFQELLEAEGTRLIFQREQEKLINIAAERSHVPLLNHIFSGTYISVNENARDHVFQRLMKSTVIWKDNRVVEVLLNNGLSCDMRDAEGHQPLHIAAKHGNRGTVRLLIEAGAAIDSIATSGGTPLLIAIQAENRSVCESLLELNAHPDIADDDGLTPVFLACELDAYEVVRLLLQYGADIGAINPGGQTALHKSVRSPKMMNILLEKDQGKHYVDVADAQHQTPLHLAAASGINKTSEAMKILIDRGADCNRKANRGQLPLHLAAESCYYDALEYLLPLTEDVNALDSKLGTPLAAAGRSTIAQHDESIRCAKLLLHKNAQINRCGGELHSPLQTVARYANIGLARLLLENGAEVNAVGGKFQSALNAAIKAKHLGLMELLLSVNADPNIKYNNRSARENAVYSGHLHILETLLNAITDIDRQISDKGQNAFRMAVKMDYLELAELMIKKGVNVQGDQSGTSLLSYILTSYSHCVLDYFLHDGREHIDINEQDIDGQTALDYAILGDIGFFGELLDAGADPNVQDKYGNTALIHALKEGSDAVSEILAYEDRKGRIPVRFELVDNIGRGPLYWACYYGRNDCFYHAMLKLSTLQYNNAENPKNFFISAIHHAAAARNRQMMLQKLIEYEIDVNRPDRNNWTALHTARAYCYEEIQRILEIELRFQGIKAIETSLKPPSLQRPLRWDRLDMHRAFRVFKDGLVLFLEDPVAEDTFSREYVRTAITDFCIPNDERVFYFEIQITRLEISKNSIVDPEIAVGLSEEHVPLDQMVGRESGSWGFHGDNGQLYGQQGKGKDFDEGYGSRHTVGCGINFSKNVGFLTKIGRFLGHFSSAVTGKLYPTVSFGRNLVNGSHITENFGNDQSIKFMYDLEKHDQVTENVKVIRRRPTMNVG
ncbi:hypothetical protein MKX08_006014 [Trichoderma sp. CBMAI-0020]|nr:hypothetical protein MKX08_006014 [Trichoderma sp. CBMAI-0020]